MAKVWLISLCYFICVAMIFGSSVIHNDSPEDALNFINEVQKKLILRNSSNIILVIGNTGSGKSTLVHYIAGDYSKIFSEEPANPNSIDYLIRDELDPDRGHITLTTESRTLIPIVSTDETNTVFVDCPGFGDTRNETVEIATTFLIKRVVENASSIKIVLVVNYGSVTENNNRDDFDNMLTRASELMKNIERFENSVSLVVTKASSFKMRGRKYIDILDNSIKNTTAQFMIDHRTVLQKKDSNENKIRLIDALIKQSRSENYPRISVFWRPNDAGPFNKLDKMIEGRRYIRESIIEHSSYATAQLNDFGFPLTPLAQIKVRNMTDYTTKTITSTLRRNVDKLIIELRHQILSTGTVKGRLEMISIGKDCINTHITAREITLNQLSERLLRLIRTYNVTSIDTKELTHINQNEKNIHILSSLIGNNENSTDANMSQMFNNVDYNLYLEQIRKFLADSETEIQNGIVKKASDSIQTISLILERVDNQLLVALKKKVKSTIGSQNRLDLLQLGKNSIRSIKDKVTLTQRVEQLQNLTSAYEIESVSVSELNKITSLEKVLHELKSLAENEIQLPVRDWIDISSHTFHYQSSMCDWYSFLRETYDYFGDFDIQTNIAEMPIVGKNNFSTIMKRIKRSAEYELTAERVSEMNDIINVTMKPPTYECDSEALVVKGNFVKSSDIRKVLQTECPSVNDLESIRVFVLDTFYVDCDLYLNKTKKVELRIIAPTWDVKKVATFYLNGVNGETYSKPAEEGLPGDEGGAGTVAGNFLGWANDVINGDWLTVELNGGNGGDGQDGGSSPDVDVYFHDDTFSESGGSFDSRTTNPNDYYRRFFRERGYIPDLTDSIKYMTYYHFVSVGARIKQTFRLYPDHCCGSTGIGGFGGEGGDSGGFLFMYQGNSKNLPKSSSVNGKTGKIGINGKICHAYALEMKIDTDLDEYVFTLEYYFKSVFYDKRPIVYSKCPSSPKYIYPSKRYKPIRLDVNLTELGNILKLMIITNEIVEYKSFLLESMFDPELPEIALKAYETIDFNSSTLGFAMEANILERHFFELNKRIDVSPLYDNLVKKIKAYGTANKLQFVQNEQEVLAYIYVTLLSKTKIIRSGHASDLIININKFLELTVENIEELNELSRINAIKNQRDDYIEGIHAKINEANAFIEHDIMPEIKQTFSLLSIQLKEALRETVMLQARNIHEIQKNEENLRVIRKNMIMRENLSFIEMAFGVIGDVCKTFFGKFVARTVNAGIEMIKDDIIDPETSKSETPSGVQRIRNKMYKSVQDKFEVLEIELKRLSDSLKNVNITNREFIENLNDLQGKVSQLKLNNSIENYNVSLLIKGSMDFLARWKTIFAVSSAESRVPILTSIQRSQHVLMVASISISTYQDIASNDEHINEIIHAINDGRETLQALRIFEDEIYSELLPTINALQEYLSEMTEDAANKSSVGLDILQWKIERTLRNVQKMLTEKLAQFDVEDSVTECMIRIKEAIKILIDIFNRIKSYQKDSELVTYLSDLQTVNPENLHIVGKTGNFFNELQLNLQSNLVLGQYYRIMNAFKQAIFPYAADYLNDFELPLSLQSKNVSMMIPFVSQRIKSLSRKLREYNDSSISENDQYIHTGYFNRDEGSRGPFFVWRNSEVKEKIEQLFSGKKVYLLADILKSDTRNAVKFRDIELEFHSENQTVNTQIPKILQSFHVSLTHLGGSNYRCNNSFYTMSSQPLTLKYSVARRNRDRTDENLVHSKLKTGTSLLSPYTMWSMQLFYGEFDKLKPFVDLVNIELHGAGLYVEENTKICETDLEKYYPLMTRW